ITIMARSFISERQTGTILRLRSAPLSNAALAAGKTIPFFLVSFVQAILLLVAGRLLFDMSLGQFPWMLLPVIFCTSLSVIGLGLLTGAAARTEAQVLSYGTFLIIVLAGISGCLMPRDWMPAAMQQLALTTPHAWALIAYDELLSGQPPDLARVWLSCLMLVVFAALFFAAGLATLRLIRRRA
ncbi:MAG: ABC transporter permease, partial [Acidobacteria bacterium]|nr:ABC transporter permease [Acidobacteriota bacterium]